MIPIKQKRNREADKSRVQSIYYGVDYFSDKKFLETFAKIKEKNFINLGTDDFS